MKETSLVGDSGSWKGGGKQSGEKEARKTQILKGSERRKCWMAQGFRRINEAQNTQYVRKRLHSCTALRQLSDFRYTAF
jgi:hypothetical protein